jgi:hypothetical protein
MDAILCTLPRWPGRAELRHRHPARTQSISIEARTRELFSAPASRPPGASTSRLPFRNELPAAHAGGVDRCELHPLRLPGWSVRVGRGSGTVGLVAPQSRAQDVLEPIRPGPQGGRRSRATVRSPRLGVFRLPRAIELICRASLTDLGRIAVTGVDRADCRRCYRALPRSKPSTSSVRRRAVRVGAHRRC